MKLSNGQRIVQLQFDVKVNSSTNIKKIYDAAVTNIGAHWDAVVVNDIKVPKFEDVTSKYKELEI